MTSASAMATVSQTPASLHRRSPGRTGRFGWTFLSGDQAASTMKQAGKFYLWEGRIIGEAVVVTE